MNVSRWKILFWISISELFALSLWFSASPILSELKKVWDLNSLQTAWITAAVQLGFIVGAFLSAYFGLSDRFNSRKMFVLSALIGAFFNSLLIIAPNAILAILFRFLTGMALAGVYPTAVKLISNWFPRGRGMAIGILIAALTLGSALPHFIVTFSSSVNWQIVIFVSSILAVISSIIMNFIVVDSTISSEPKVVSFNLLKKVLANKPVMLANGGYFGHMWELYAMWTWLPVFIIASLNEYAPFESTWLSAFLSFCAIGIAGAFGCVLGGYYADKIGKARLTIIAMIISALCCIGIGFTYGGPVWITLILSLIWGMSVIADSAQFSAAVTEYAESEYVGTALTFQMSVGFLITVISINLISILQEVVGWNWVFLFLSLGPLIGIFSMIKLRKYELKEID